MTTYSRNTYNVEAIAWTGSNQSALRDAGYTFTTNPHGQLIVSTSDDSTVICAVGDYVVRWLDMTVSVIPKAEFEADFTEVTPP